MKQAKTIIISLVVAIVVIFAIAIVAHAVEVEEPAQEIVVEETTQTSEVYIPSEIQIELEPLEIEIIETEDKELLLQFIKEYSDRKFKAHEMAEAARALGYPEDHPIIEVARDEWWNSQNTYAHYLARYAEVVEAERKAEELRWQKKMDEYPAATTIWKYLKDLGYNDYVCAGILGNIMIEVGGRTLDIQYWLYGSNYYGICQWSPAYHSVWGTDLQTQCDFLKDTIQYEFDTYGRNYYQGFNYNSFLNLQNEQEAALAFAKCYERCSSRSYELRQKCATKAYNYFTN